MPPVPNNQSNNDAPTTSSENDPEPIQTENVLVTTGNSSSEEDSGNNNNWAAVGEPDPAVDTGDGTGNQPDTINPYYGYQLLDGGSSGRVGDETSEDSDSENEDDNADNNGETQLNNQMYSCTVHVNFCNDGDEDNNYNHHHDDVIAEPVVSGGSDEVVIVPQQTGEKGYSMDEDRASGDPVNGAGKEQMMMEKSSSVHLKDSDFPVEHSPRIESIPGDADHLNQIKSCMSGFSLPPDNTPAWARQVPESEWKSHLLSRLNTSTCNK